MVEHFDAVFVGALLHEQFNAPFCRLGGAMHQAAVALIDLPQLDLFVHHPQGGGCFGADHQAGGVPVDAVAQGGGKALLGGRVVLTLFSQISQNAPDQGVRRLAFVLVHHQPGGFVHQQQVLVLVDDGHHRACKAEALLRGGIEEFVADVHLHQIPDGQPSGDLAPLAVELDALQAKVFVHQAFGQQRHRLGDEFVHALSGVIFPDGKAPHA